MIVAGVNNITKFVQASQKSFGSYIKYMARDEAIRNKTFSEYNAVDFSDYQHYMVNPEKTGGLFNNDFDRLDGEQCLIVRDLFLKAQENGSVMWQDVISFDNRWLEKHGAYNSYDGFVNEELIRQSVRRGVNKMLEKEGMSHSAIWTAAIHFNTDNIHVHIATVEPQPTRPTMTVYGQEVRRGKRKLSSLDAMKQQVASQIMNRDESLKRLSNIIRNDLTLANGRFEQSNDRELRELFQTIYEKLPSDKRLWKYNNQALSSVRPDIDNFITTFIEKYKHNELDEVDKMINDEIKIIEETYGKGSKQSNRSANYRETKYKEIYTRMGNQLLKEIKNYDKSRFEFKENSNSKVPSINNSLHTLKKLLNPKKSYKNQQIYDELHKQNNENKGHDLSI